MLALPSAFMGCAAPSGVVDGNSLNAGNSVLALQLSTNVTGGYIGLAPYTDSQASGVARELFSLVKENFQLVNGETNFLRQMPPGDYMWNELVVPMKKASLYSRSKISVLPDSITYVGHLRITVYETRYELRVVDREQDMRNYLSDSYPRLLNAISFRKRLAEVGLRG